MVSVVRHAAPVCLSRAIALMCGLIACAAPALAQHETFTGSTAPGWEIGGVARLTAAQPDPIDAEGEGWLRLTPAERLRQGYAFFETPINPAIGLHVEFEYAIYGGSGGTGGDGLTFFMFDGSTPTTSFQIGAPGGSLGYAQTTKNLAGRTVNQPGIDKGFLGVGFDTFGDFSNPTEGRIGGPGRTPDAIVIRGPGNALQDYEYVVGTASLSPGVGTGTGRPTSPADPNYRHVIVDVTPVDNDRYTVRVVLQRGQTQTEVIPPTLLPEPGWNAKPANLKFGFAATTSEDGTNIHEVRLFSAAPPVNHGVSKAVQGLTGSTIVYTVTATNTGPNADPAARIVDTGAAGLVNQTWTCTSSGGASCAPSGSGPLETTANLPLGGVVTYTVTGTLSSLATSPLVNTATVYASAGVADVDLSNNVASASATLMTDLVITKSAAPSYTPGADHVYTIDVVNTGALTVFGARVTDAFPAGLTGTWACQVVTASAICNLAGRSSTTLADVLDIAPGGRVRYTVRIPVPSGQIGDLTNTAAVTLPPSWIDATPPNNTASAASLAGPRADLTVSKVSTPNPSLPGQPLTYTIVVTNPGPSNVHGATVNDTFPPSLEGVSWTCLGNGGGVCTVPAGSGNLDTPVTLPAGASVTFRVSATAPNTATDLVNTVQVVPPAGVIDPAPGNNTATDANPTLPLADLVITKAGAPDPYRPGEPLTYTVVVSNRGPDAATDARVQDILPESIVASASWGCAAGPNASCSVASGSGHLDTLVSMGAGAQVTFSMTATAPAVPGPVLFNTATVTAPASVTDPAPGNNSATSTITAPGTANLRIEKTSAPRPYVPGMPLQTTIVVHNEGPADVVNARVLDLPPAGLGNPTWTCTTTAGACGITSGSGQIDALISLPAAATATFVLTAVAPATLGATLTNTSTVTPPPDIYDPLPGDNEATHSNPAIAGSDLVITKSATPSAYVPGQSLTYTIDVINRGLIAAEHARLQDALPPAVAEFSWTCAGVSGGATCATAAGQGAIDVLVTLPVIGARVRVVVTGVVGPDVRGPITNTATIAAPKRQEDPDPTNNTASLTTPMAPAPDLGITKTAMPSLLYRPGEALSFQLRVTNHGSVDIPVNGYTITDALPPVLHGVAWVCVVAPSGECRVSGGALATSNLPALAPGEQITITLNTTVPPTAFDPLQNTASAAITVPGLVDADPRNNTATIAMFASALASAAIMGLVTDGDGSPLPAVVVRLEGAVILETTTAVDGTYAFPGLPPAHDYTVTPVARGYVFTPPSRTFTELIGNARADFVGLVEPYIRYYSEGSTGEFFTTTFSLTNPNRFPANVSFRFQLPDGPEITHALTMAPEEHIDVDPSMIAGMASTPFATIVAADRQIVTTRTMSWDRSAYGVHRGTGVGTPRTAWYVAEGATLPRFSLFYLLQNPGDAPANVTIRYLLQAAEDASIERTYAVAPRSRYTIAVHDDPALVGQELSAEILSDGPPIVVERAMYRSGPRFFEAGAAVTAAPAPASSWYFAEGATGAYFDEFLLLANPGQISVTATVSYFLPEGGVIVRQHDLPAGTRRTIWVEYEAAALSDTAVSVLVEASGPIVAERAMWWPGSSDTWTGGHATLGATNVAPRWGVSGLVAGGPAHAEPWLLIANPTETSTTIRMTLLFDDGRPAVIAEYPVAAQSRFTIAVGQWHPETANASFGAVIEQLGEPTGIIVESAVYQDSGGVVWAAGRGGMAAPIP